MHDPFSAHSNSQLIREAQRGFAIVAVLLALLGYVIFFKFIGSLTEIPEHVREAPIAQPIWPYNQPPTEPPTEPKSKRMQDYQVDQFVSGNPKSGNPKPVERALVGAGSATEPYSHDLPDFQLARRQSSPPSDLIHQDPALNSTFDVADRGARNDKPSFEKGGFEKGVFEKGVFEKGVLAESTLPRNSVSPTAVSPPLAGKQTQVPAATAGVSGRGLPPMESQSARPLEGVATAVQPASHNGLANEEWNFTAEAQALGIDSAPVIELAAHQGQANQPIHFSDTRSFQTMTSDSNLGKGDRLQENLRDSSPGSHKDFLPGIHRDFMELAGPGSQEIAAQPAPVVSTEPGRTDQPRSLSLVTDALGVSQGWIGRLIPWGRQTGSPDRVRQVGLAGGQPGQPLQKFHRVKVNESFWTISQQHYDSGEYFRWLYLYNQVRVGDYEGLRPGLELEIPELETLRAWVQDDSNQDKAGVLTASAELNLWGEHITFSGETLFSIAAERLGQASRYLEIWELNRDQLSADAQYLSPLPAGLRLRLPK
jgi:nucleoid-associated protein YgaU